MKTNCVMHSKLNYFSVSGSDEDIIPQFEPKTFFLFLLPPIMLESAYSLHDRAFAENIGTVLLYAVVGTIINCFTIGE
uniref:Cation/H+ exchanger transmembrane domain-containing protein n=1 Tax=Strigamia maritima TaxID=126957 RepID=T1JHJ5_STRMM